MQSFVHMLKHKKVELFWFLVAFTGVSSFIVTELFFDNKDNPLLLTHLSAICALVTASLFLFNNSFTDKVLRYFLFSAWSVTICVALGRSYLDFDQGGPWIIYFQQMKAEFSSPELYRAWDFAAHYLTPLGYIHVALNNASRLKKVFAIHSQQHIFLQYLLCVGFFIAWYAIVSLSGYSLHEIYLIKSMGLSQGILLVSVIPLVTVIPIHYCMSSMVGKRDFFERGLTVFMFLSSFFILASSVLVYEKSLLWQNSMSIVSFFIFLVTLLRILRVLSIDLYHYILPIVACMSIFSFLVTELHFWSAGGAECVYAVHLKPISFCSAIDLHFCIKMVFYLSIVLVSYIHSSFFIHHNLRKLTKNFSTKYHMLVLLANFCVFGLFYKLGVFKRYDILYTTYDLLYFFISMVASVELVFPRRYIAKKV